MSPTRVLTHLTASALAAGALALPSAAAQAAAGTAVIRGTVLETGRVIAPGIDVSLYRASGEFVDATVADSAAGAYSFRGLEAGSYIIWFENQNEAVSEWYENQPDKAHATPITVTAGQTFVADAYLTQISENLVRPTISGTPRVDSVLTASRGSWYPVLGVDFTCQWLRNGVPIGGATGATYRLRNEDAGSAVSVRVIATVQGAQETATSAPTATVTGGTAPIQTIANTAKPVISGSTVVGSRLTATTGTWTPTDAGVSLQWLRGDRVVGTGDVYVTTTDDIGASLVVRATATRSGWTQAVSDSVAFGPITTAAPTVKAPVNTAAPTVSGTARVGGALTAGPGAWSTSVSPTFRWTRNGRAIPGATGRTYRLVPADAGRRVAVVVTARNAAGSASAASGARTVAKATSRLAASAKAAGKRRLSVKIVVSSAGARSGRVTVTVRSGGRTKVTRTTLRAGQRTVTVTGLRTGRATVRVVYAGDASTRGASVTKKATVR